MVNHNIQGLRIFSIDILDFLTSDDTTCQLTGLATKCFIVRSVGKENTFFNTSSITTDNWYLRLLRKVDQGIDSTNDGVVRRNEDNFCLTHQALSCVLDIIG